MRSFFSRVAVAWALTVSPPFATTYGAYQLDGSSVSNRPIRAYLATSPAARLPRGSDDTTMGRSVGDLWQFQGSIYQNLQNVAGEAVWQRQLAPPLPCDAVVGAQACYGMTRIKASYRGAAVAGECVGASTSYTINFLANGSIDYATMDNDCQGAAFRVTTWYDQSGAGNNAVQTTTATSATADPRPGITSLNMVGPARGMVFDTVYRGSASYPAGEQPNNVYMTIPSLTATGTNLCMITAVKMDSTSLFGSVVEADTASAGTNGSMGLGMFGTGTGNVPRIVALQSGGSSSELTATVPINASATVLGTNATASAWTISYGNYTLANGVGGAPTYTNGIIGATDRSIGNMAFTVSAIVIAPAQTAAQYAVALGAMNAAYNLAPQMREQISLDGDSRTEGFGSSLMLGWPTQFANLLPKPINISNTAVWGDTLANHNTNFQLFSGAEYSPNATQQIFVQFAGYNDLANATYTGTNTAAVEAAAIYADAQSWVSKVHALGTNVTVVLSTVTTNGAPSANVTAAIADYNTLVRNGASRPSYVPGSQTSGYALADPASDPTLNSATNMANTTYSVDQVHWTNLMCAYPAQDFAAALVPYL